MAKKAGTETAAPAAALKPLVGRKKGMVKTQAREQLPDGTPEALSERANQIAVSEGYEPSTSPEDFADDDKPTPRRSRNGAAAAGSGVPTLTQIIAVESLLAEKKMTADTLSKGLDNLNAFVGAAGSLDSLKAIIGFLNRG